MQALDTGCSEAPSPLADGLWCDAEAEGDRRVGQAFGAGENHACPLDQGVGQGGRPGNSVELILLLVGEREWYQWASVWHGSLPCLKPAAYDTHLRDATLVLSVCALPRRSMGHQRQYVRRTGDYMLAFNATDPDYGLPYGVYPRLLFAWICTEAVRTKTPRLVLGRSLNEFLTTLGIKSSNSRGNWDVRTHVIR